MAIEFEGIRFVDNWVSTFYQHYQQMPANLYGHCVDDISTKSTPYSNIYFSSTTSTRWAL